MGMTKSEKKVLYEIKEKVISIENKVDTQNGRVSKSEVKIDTLEGDYNKLDKKLSVYNIWDKLKSIALYLMSAVIGAMGTYIFLRPGL